MSLRSTARNISKDCGSRHPVAVTIGISFTDLVVLEALSELSKDHERVRALSGGGLCSSDGLLEGSEGGVGLRRSWRRTAFGAHCAPSRCINA